MRSGAIDAVRVVGITAVVAGHSLNSPLVRPLLFSWHVPLFFFLAGYLWNARGDVRHEISKRARTLGRPWITWILLSGSVYILVERAHGRESAARLVEPIVDGQRSPMPYTTLWFVSALFFTVVLLRLLWRLPRSVLAIIALGGLLLGSVAGDMLASTPLAAGSAVSCLPFVLLGSFAAHVRASIRHPLVVALALLASAAALIGTGLAAPLDIKKGDYGTPGISALAAVAVSFGLVLSAEVIFNRLPGWVSLAATGLSRAGFTVVLLHPLIIWLVLGFLWPAPAWVIFGLALSISWAIGLLASRTPISPWLTGSAATRTFRAPGSQERPSSRWSH